MSEIHTVTSRVTEIRKTGTDWTTWSGIGPGNLRGEKARKRFPGPEDWP